MLQVFNKFMHADIGRGHDYTSLGTFRQLVEHALLLLNGVSPFHLLEVVTTDELEVILKRDLIVR